MLLRSAVAVSGLRNLARAAARRPTVSATPTLRFGLHFGKMAEAPAREIHVERRLEELGLRMPAPSKPVASYVMCTRVGNLLYLAGHLPQPAEGPLVVGKVGTELTTEQAADAAKLVALNILATLKGASPRPAEKTMPLAPSFAAVYIHLSFLCVLVCFAPCSRAGRPGQGEEDRQADGIRQLR